MVFDGHDESGIASWRIAGGIETGRLAPPVLVDTPLYAQRSLRF
jgi:hypothetical protein